MVGCVAWFRAKAVVVLAGLICFLCLQICVAAGESPEAAPGQPNAGQAKELVATAGEMALAIDQINVIQSCKHTSVSLGDGEEAFLDPGLLLIDGGGMLRYTGTKLISYDAVDLRLRAAGGDWTDALLIDPRAERPIGAGAAGPRSGEAAPLKFTCVCDGPLGVLELRLGDGKPVEAEGIPPGKPRFDVELASDVIVTRGGLTVTDGPDEAKGNSYDTVEVSLQIASNSRVSWVVCPDEVIHMRDSAENDYGLLHEQPDCEPIAVLPGERQAVTLMFAGMPRAGTGMVVELGPPFSNRVVIPDSRVKEKPASEAGVDASEGS